jgi:putative colanic acid biosynthesis UDP-glucose lipid carrier transferase
MLRSQPGPGPLLQAALDPLVAIGTFAAAASFFGASFDGACLILALLVFAMTFPGGLVKDGGRGGDLMLDIVTGWVAVIGLLGLLGWATQTTEVFDPRVLLAWAFATPVTLFAAHRLLPVILPRVLAVEGMRKDGGDRGRPATSAASSPSA